MTNTEDGSRYVTPW